MNWKILIILGLFGVMLTGNIQALEVIPSHYEITAFNSWGVNYIYLQLTEEDAKTILDFIENDTNFLYITDTNSNQMPYDYNNKTFLIKVPIDTSKGYGKVNIFKQFSVKKDIEVLKKMNISMYQDNIGTFTLYPKQFFRSFIAQGKIKETQLWTYALKARNASKSINILILNQVAKLYTDYAKYYNSYANSTFSEAYPNIFSQFNYSFSAFTIFNTSSVITFINNAYISRSIIQDLSCDVLYVSTSNFQLHKLFISTEYINFTEARALSAQSIYTMNYQQATYVFNTQQFIFIITIYVLLIILSLILKNDIIIPFTLIVLSAYLYFAEFVPSFLSFVLIAISIAIIVQKIIRYLTKLGGVKNARR